MENSKKVFNIKDAKRGIVKDTKHSYIKVKFKPNGEEIKVLDRPNLAKILSEEIQYKQYMKQDYKYNGFYYEKIEDEEHLQLLVKKKLDGVIAYTVRDINEVIMLMKMECTVNSVIEKRYLCVQNGIIDLKEMKFLKHSPDFFTTFMIKCDYTPRIDVERWRNSYLKFYFDTTFQEDENLIRQAQEIIAMSLKPNPKLFKKMVCLLGEGSNGKSIFMNIIKALQGNQVSTVPLKAIDSDRFALSEMIGVNVNIDDDATGSRLNETSNLKKITTGGALRTERKGKQGMTTTLDILMIIALNKMPSSCDKTHGFTRRFNILPFNSEFTDDIEKIDSTKHVYGTMPELEYNIINEELDILLSMSINLLKELEKRSYRLTKSNKVEQANEEYKLLNDSVLAFVMDNKEGTFKHDSIKAKVIYEHYCDWCTENECTPVTNTNFGRSFAKHYQKGKKKTGIVYLDVVLKEKITDF